MSGQSHCIDCFFVAIQEKLSLGSNAMAFVNVGSLHSESKSLTVIQQGKSTVSVALRNDLLSSDSSEWLIAYESLQVPLIIRFPGQVRGRRVAAPAQHLDLLLGAAGKHAESIARRSAALVHRQMGQSMPQMSGRMKTLYNGI